MLYSHTAPLATAHTFLKMSLSVVRLVTVPHELPVIGWRLIFYWLTQLSSASFPISPGQYTALAQQAFLRGSNTFALIFRTEKLKCEHPSSMPPAATSPRGPPLCTLLSVSIHPLFTRLRTCPCPVIIYTHTAAAAPWLGNSLPTF